MELLLLYVESVNMVDNSARPIVASLIGWESTYFVISKSDNIQN